MKKFLSVIFIASLLAVPTTVLAEKSIVKDDNFEFSGVEELAKKESRHMFGQLHKQSEFVRSVNRMKAEKLRIDFKNSKAYSVESFKNIEANEVQQNVKVYLYPYTSNKGTEGKVVIIYKDGHIIENGTSIYSK